VTTFPYLQQRNWVRVAAEELGARGSRGIRRAATRDGGLGRWLVGFLSQISLS
jgi:hypothetical protein